MQRNAQVKKRYFCLSSDIQIMRNLCCKFQVTPPMEVRPATPKIIHVPQVPALIETRETAISPVVILPKSVMDESTEPAPSRLTVPDDQTESIKAVYEDKITKIHENYQ